MKGYSLPVHWERLVYIMHMTVGQYVDSTGQYFCQTIRFYIIILLIINKYYTTNYMKY